MAKQATPAHYVVDKTGPSDPSTAEYFVLDVMNDPIAREVLASLGNKYRQHKKDQLSRECFDLLDRTRESFAAVIAARQPKGKSGSGKQKNAHP